MDASFLASIFNVILVLYIILIVIILLLENRDPNKTIAWILIFLLLPVIGVIAYFYLGQNWKKKQFIKNFQTRELHSLLKKKKDYLTALAHTKVIESIKDGLQKRLIKSIERATGFGLALNNHLDIFNEPKEFYDSLKRDLKTAQKFIHLEFYRIRSDKIGNEIKNILVEKAKKGIEVRVMYDFLGSIFKMKQEFRKEMKDAGITVIDFFSPLKLFSHHKLNYRNHRKIVVIDGVIAYLGGSNIGDEHINGGDMFSGWRDLNLRTEGEIVKHIELIFLYDWYLATKKNIIKEMYLPRPNSNPDSKILLQAVHSGPESDWETMKQVFFMLISNAKKSIHIISPYFIPDNTLYMALKNAALSGVDVKIILPSRFEYDQRIAFYASRTYFEELLEAGVKLYEYRKGFIHAKTIIVDSFTATVGTSNFDTRSLNVNFEINLMIYTNAVVSRIQNYFNNTLEHSWRIELDNFRKRRISRKLGESIARLLSPIL